MVKLREEIKKQDLDKKSEKELVDLCKRNIPIDSIESALESNES